MSLFKRGSVYWSYFYLDGVRHQASTGTANRRQAETIEAKLREEANAQRFQVVQADPRTTVGELAARAEVLERAITAAGEVARLEDALNHNLAALAGAKHFEQTVLSLAAAVNMLSARLAETPNAVPIKLESKRHTAHAA